MLKRLLTTLVLINSLAWATAQSPQYLVEFDTGQTAISLAQLDSIKALVKQSRATGLTKIRVLAYAHDAKKGDTNEQLSRRRAYLIQQCLEREGVPLSKLHIQNIVCDATIEVCTACANLSLEEGDDSRLSNSYTQRNREFLYQQSSQEQERFWIDPSQENYLVSQAGILIYLPANALVTSYNSPVQLTLKVLDNSRQNWWNGLTTTTEEGMLLAQQSLYLQATQEGALLPATLREPITIVLPHQQAQPQPWKLWQQKQQDWELPSPHSATALFLGDYYNKEENACADGHQGGIHTPNYGAAPERPAYINIQEATALQDAAIAALEERLQPLEAAQFNKSGKKEIWTPQQKQRAFQLKNQKSQLLVTREKIRREAQNKNLALEEAYYKALGAYNKKRHHLQTQYIQSIEQQARQARLEGAAPETILAEDPCFALQQYQQLLQTAYAPKVYQQLQQKLAQVELPAAGPHWGYWVKSEALGWMALGQTQKVQGKTAHFYAQSNISPYKITAYYHQEDGQVFQGQAQENGQLIFEGIDPQQKGEVLAVVKKEGEFWLALQPIGGNAVSLANKTIGLQFEYQSLQEALEAIAQ